MSYEELRKGYNRRFDVYPDIIYLPDTISEIQEEVESLDRVTVRSGGHSTEGQSLSNDTIIDLRRLNRVSLVNTEIAKVEMGSTLGYLYSSLAKYGYVTIGGTCPDVGIGGISLSGGIGYLTRKYGLICDNILEYDVILANGDRVIVNKNHYSDLYWALRGGGGSFCLVTSIKMKIYHIPIACVFTIDWVCSPEVSAHILFYWQKWAYTITEDLTCDMQVLSTGLRCQGLYIGSKSILKTLLYSLISIYKNKMRIVETIGTDAIQMLEDECKSGYKYKVKSGMSNKYVSSDFFKLLSLAVRNTPKGGRLSIGIIPMGGQVNKIPNNATAFYHRDSIFWIQIGMYWKGSNDKKYMDYINFVYKSIVPYLTPGIYPNWPDRDITDWEYQYYGSNIYRLKKIKCKYDPENKFRFLHSIQC